MGDFQGVRLTEKGKLLQAKVQTGQKLIIPRVMVGSGNSNGGDITKLTSLIAPQDDALVDIIGNRVTGNGSSELEIRVKATDTPFYLREIGIMATDPDDGEILYAYTNAGIYADYMPTGSSSMVQDIILVTAIGNITDDEIEINITLSSEIKREEFEELRKEVDNIGNTTNSSMTAKITDLEQQIDVLMGLFGMSVYDGGWFGEEQNDAPLDCGLFEDEELTPLDCGGFEPYVIPSEGVGAVVDGGTY